MHTLRISIVDMNKTLSLNLDLDTVVYDICRDLFKRIKPNQNLLVEEFGLFVPDPDSTRAYWLDNSKPVSYYPLGDKNLVLLYKSRLRRLIIRTMDDTKKTLEVDDSKSIAEIILPICNKIGISNHEEYSLIHELDENERMKTMTLKRGKTQIRDFEKLEKMKQKLKTDDDLNWLPHGKTLRQLGIDEKDELLLRRKYFFSDQNVDARDPIQLNLLYVQLKNAIIDGTHPVNIEEAIQLAGIQCQAELGNLAPDKAKTIHSNLKDFLPKEYIKTKGIDKKIISQYEKLSGKCDKDVKVMYAQLCRSLKTYGITFFLVKEKVRAKNKLVPRLMGISKEKVMRVDEKTKEIVHSWPLTTVRRYAATASLFSLDFGDYSDENYVIQTTEGEKIAQLIGGYIDIIIKKQKAKENLIPEADEETAMIEENVAPSKANVISHNLIDKNTLSYEQNSVATIGQIPNRRGEAGVISQGRVGPAQPIAIRNDSRIGQGHINAQPQKFQIRDLSQPKRALMIRIGDNLKILKAATEDLDKHIEVAKLGNDESSRNYRKQTLDIAKSRVKGNLMSMTMATGNLLMMMQHDEDSEDSDDYSRIDAAITTIGYNTDKLLENVRQVYEMTYETDDDENNSGNLIEAAKTLLNAFQDLLNASKPVNIDSDLSLSDESINNEKTKFSDKALMDAVNRVGEASRLLLHLISIEHNQISDLEWETRDTLLTDAKQIANLVSGMVKIVKEASVALKETKGVEAQSMLIHAAKNSGQATSMLISAAKVVACSIEQPLSQQQLHSSAGQVIDSIENVMQLIKPLKVTHNIIFQQLEETIVMIFESIEKLKEHLIYNSITAHQDPLVTKFLSASERLPAAIGNSSEMVTQAQILAQAGTELADCLNSAAMTQSAQNNISQSTSSLDSDRQRRLMIAAQALTDAVGKLVQATKICVKESEQTIENQQVLMQAAHHMTSVAHMTAGEIIRQRLSKGLEFAGRQTALTADQLVLSSQEAAKTTRASNYQICSESQEMTETVLPEVILACSKIRENPIDPNAQNNLLNACQKLIQNLEQLLKSSEALEPRVKDPSIQCALNISMQNSQTSLADLKQCVQQADTVFKPTVAANIASLEDGQLQILHSWMDTAAESVARGELYPLPGETIESVSAIIGSSSKTASKVLDKLYNNLPDMNNFLMESNSENISLQSDFIRSAKELMDSMERLLRGARGMAALKSKTDSNENLYEKQIEVIDCGKQIIRSGENVVQGIKLASIGAVSIDELKKSIDKMKEDIDDLVYRIPAYQEIDSLINKLKDSTKLFDEKSMNKPLNEATNKTKSHSQVQSEFTTAVALFNQTLGDLINSNLTHSALTLLSQQLNESHDCMLTTGLQLIAEVPNNQQQLTSGLKCVSSTSTDLLDHLKLLLAATGSSDVNLLKQSLLKAASMVSDSINDLLSACASTLPVTQQLCESSQRQLEALKTNLLAEPPLLPINDLSYNQCMQSVDELSQALLTQMKRIPVTCKTGDSNEFCSAVQILSSVTVDMMKVATQANYKLGVIQSNSSIASVVTVAHPLLDSLVQHSNVISKNCISIASNDNSEIPYRELANDIKSRASSVCQIVKECINNSDDSDHQNKLLEAGKQVAEATANLIKTINSCPRSNSGDTDAWTVACKAVANTVDQLLHIAKYKPICKTTETNITEQGRQAQIPIHQASIDVVEGSCSLLRAASALVRDSKSIPANQAFIINQKTYDNCLSRLNNIVKYSAPGQREFIEMEEELKQLLRNLDRANMDSFVLNKTSKMNARSTESINSDLQRIQLSLKQLKNNIHPIDNVLIDPSKLEYLGRVIWQAGSYLAPIAESANNLAQLLPHSRDRGEVVELTKTILEAFLAMVQECEAIFNSNNIQEITEHASSLKIGIDDLTKFIDGIASCHGTVENMISAIQKSSARLSESTNTTIIDAAAAHTLIFQSIKGITDSVSDISLCKDTPGTRLQKKESTRKIRINDNSQILSQNKTSDVNNPLKKIIQDYDSLITGVIQIMASGAFGGQEGDDKLKKCVVAVGQSCMDLIRYDQSEFTGQVRSRLTDLMYLLQSSSRGTQCCIMAANSVNEMVNDLDTAVLFASSGTLTISLISTDEENKLNSVSQIKEEIFKITKFLVSDLQKMVTSVDGKQENLAMATDNAVRRANQLCNAVKNSALAIGSNPSLLGLPQLSEECVSAQTLLINAVRDVAVALVDFFNCTKMNVTAGVDKERDRANLKGSLETMVKSVDGLIKSVKSLEDSGCRGTRALEASLEAMRKEYKLLEVWIPDEEVVSNSTLHDGEYSQINVATDVVPLSDKVYSMENLVLMTKPLVTASQKAMTAVQTFKQEDILIAANAGRRAVSDLVHQIRVTVDMKLKEEKAKPSRIFSENVPITSDPDRRSSESVKSNSLKIVEHGKSAVKALIDMYENLNKSVSEGKKGESHKMQMTLASRRIAHSIHEITESATQIKDTRLIDQEDSNNSANIAENELLEAASQIEMAAKKLALLKPRKSIKKETGEEYTFDGQIIVACGSIVSATSHLVKMASLSQQELVALGRMKPSENVSCQHETQWTHGLVSAARLVAAATENLSDSAKAVVQGKSGTDRLISASKQVAAGTAHLLLACQVKSDPDSISNQRLQAAGAAVKKATEALVKEATEHRDVQDGSVPYTYDGSNKSMVSSMRNVIQAQADIVAKERELEMLRNKYQSIRQGHISTHPELFNDKD